ncbi:MAG TPA: hypothetical protein VMJ32_14505 [Pirellulales bacterium]|nr:hypothetical protein [Pirellulales bacterium]
MDRNLEIPVFVWFRLVRCLRKAGRGIHESGAFLLGVRGEWADKVTSFVLYNELNSHALDTGIITFASDGFSNLWKVCRERNARVLADVHTHPGIALQSNSDRQNPMIGEVSHMAIILPNYAMNWCLSLRGVGFFEYRGNLQWTDWTKLEHRRQRIHLSLW